MTNKKLDDALFLAVFQNDITKARELILEGANVNSTSTNIGKHRKITPLFYAKSEEMARLLIQHGANINQKDMLGSTPLHDVKNVAVARVLIQNGANLNQTNTLGETPEKANPNPKVVALIQEAKKKLTTKTSVRSLMPSPKKTEFHTYEFDYSNKSVSDQEIRTFLKTYINFKSNPKASEELLFQSLKETLQTPTARMTFRATRGYLENKRNMGKPHKINLDIPNTKTPACFGCSWDNNIEIYPNSIKNQYTNQKHIHFQIGSTFLHEALHTRNDSDYNRTISDATTSALSRQIAVECPYIEIRDKELVSKKERSSYLAAAFTKDSLFRSKQAKLHSIKMQQLYIKDFVQKPGNKPEVNYAYYIRQVCYILPDIHFRLLTGKANNPDPKSYEYIKTRFGVDMNYEDLVNNQVYQALSKQAREARAICSEAELKHLFDAIDNQKTLNSKCFSSKKAYNTALSYFNTSNDIKSKLVSLAFYSHLIHDDPENKFYLEESRKVRAHLLSKYDIDIALYNKFCERIAEDGVDIVKETPDKPYELLIKEQSDMLDEQRNTDHTNPTLAQNAQTLPDEKSSPTTYTEKTRTT